MTRPRNNLPPAVVLPERLIHNTGRVIPGQFAGVMGRQRDPWFIEASPFEPKAYGAYPEYEFDHQQRPSSRSDTISRSRISSLPQGVDGTRLSARLDVLKTIDEQRAALDRGAAAAGLDRHRQAAVSLLTEPRVRRAFDVDISRPKDRRPLRPQRVRLVAADGRPAGRGGRQPGAGEPRQQRDVGHARQRLPAPEGQALPADGPCGVGAARRPARARPARLDADRDGRRVRPHAEDLGLPQHYKLPGRDHWGAVQTVFLAGGGVKGGTVVGSSDKIGGYPATDPQTPENMAATIYPALGIPKAAVWHDAESRPHHVYHGEPIAG